MHEHRVAETDALFDTRPEALAARFGYRTLAILRAGGEPRTSARLAATFAAKAIAAREEDDRMQAIREGDRR